MNEYIHIKGARVNNLKNIDLDIPRNKLIVITGLSGSGKSSLAFDTLYAEGQRRYVESLSAYARQFLGRMSKPECDYIKGIPPAIAIEQKVSSRNPRSTVGTSTEIYEYLRLLYARIGRTFSPVSGTEVKKHTPEDVVQCMLSYSAGTRFLLLAPLAAVEGRSLAEQLDSYFKQGFSRIEADGEVVYIEDFLRNPALGTQATVNLVIDRMVCNNTPDAISRLTDSVETAFYEGNGQCMMRIIPSGILHTFSTRFEADGMSFEEPGDLMFSFNSPIGACPVCEGFGKTIGPDEKLVIPNSTLSVYEGAVACWRGEIMSEWKNRFCREAQRGNFPIFTPYCDLTREQKAYLWHGNPKAAGEGSAGTCLDAFFKALKEESYKIQFRVMLARYQGKTTCPACHGTRLRREAGYVKIGGRSISSLVEMPVGELKKFFDNLQLTEHEEQVGKRLLAEIRNRLQFLLDVGLGYLTLNRPSNSLSGGESQRINLATSLGSSLVGSLYILDEPSIGLHSRDTDKLIHVLRQLQQIGNTVIVVEHDEEIIRAADYIIDIGPKAGRLGGEVVFQGDLQKMLAEKPQDTRSYTVKYLTRQEDIPLPAGPRPWNNYIGLKGAKANNLRGIDVRFPLNVMTVVTGVSGSGKSTLVRDTLYRALMRHLDKPADRPGEHLRLEGDLQMVRNVEFVDQNPIGKSTRSNPVTYVKAYDEIRKLFAAQPLAQQMGYTAGYFSFNTEGGRCEECKGEGTVKVEMQFMADLVLECESCHGKRFKKDLLEVRFGGQNINDVLNMTVDQAMEFFAGHQQGKIAARLKPLRDVGLGYIKLGQSSSTLSGGENQRVKLAYYLGLEKTDPTVFIFDEPTTGLHFHDIKRLMAAFNALIGQGHTLIVIEHNLDVIKCADYIIDLGPEGGQGGGGIVVCGTPQEVAACTASYTGRYLKEKLGGTAGTDAPGILQETAQKTEP